MNANYTMITVAAIEAGFTEDALGHTGILAGELKDQANCVSARYGTIGTGTEAGSLILFQSYAGLGDIEKVFEVYASSSAYQALVNSGRLSVTMRNIVKLEDVQLSNPSAETPGYGVVTVVGGPAVTAERMKGLVPIFDQSGAILMRFGTLITGSNAGKRLIGVTYPSMDAIEKTYDGLRASADYQSLMAESTLVRREIIRFAG